MSDELPPHMLGNKAPVHDEVTAVDLPVEGQVPRELSGQYVRIGPNPMIGVPRHWFFGNGMVHGTELRDGKATAFRNRWVKTQLLGRPPSELLLEDGTIDLGNTLVLRHAGRTFALCEFSLPIELTREMETIGRYDFGGRLKTWMTAHPNVCPDTGELHSFGYGFEPPYLTYYVADADGNLVRSEVVDVPAPSMIHDFCLTERHVIFPDFPVLFDEQRLLERVMPFRWSDEHGARLGVMPRGASTAEIRWFGIEPCYVFHFVNAFDDDGDRIVIDGVRYPEMYRESSLRSGDATLHRWIIDPVAGKVSETALDDRSEEFPRTDDRRVGRPYRYSFTVGYQPGGDTVLLKRDLAAGTVAMHDFGPGRQAGEGCFVPASDRAGEDEGYVLTYVYDPERHGTDLVVLDAHDFTDPPVATVRLPQRVPSGFHTAWLPD